MPRSDRDQSTAGDPERQEAETYGHSTERPEPTAQFRVIIPAEAAWLVENGEISPAEAFILGVIDGLVNHKKDEGCFASNAYLAKKCGVKERAIQYSLSNLTKLGLVVHSTKQVERSGHKLRTIETKWSRGAKPCRGTTQSFAGGPRKVLPPEENTSLRSVSLREENPPNPPAGGSSQSGPAGPQRTGGASAPAGPQRASGLLNTTEQSGTIWDQWACRLYKVVTVIHKIHRAYSQKKWATSFRLLLSDAAGDEARVEHVVTWYEVNAVTMEYPVESAEKFRKRFFTDLEPRSKKVGYVPKSAHAAVHTLEVQEILKELEGKYKLHSTPRHELLDFLQTTWDNYAPFSKRVVEVHARLKSSDKNSSLVVCIEWMWREHMPKGPREFTRRWAVYTLADLTKWKEWSGSLKGRAWAVDGERAMSYGHWMAAKTDDPKLWTRLLTITGSGVK